MWWIYALLSAVFAALTAIFAKVGVKGVDSDLATAIRTIVILFIAWGIAFVGGGVKTYQTLTSQNLWFLTLSGIATGLSWIFYFKALQLGKVSQVAMVDKLSVALVLIFAVLFLGETLDLKTVLAGTLIISGTLLLVL